MTTTDLEWIMDDSDDVDEINDSRVCGCKYEESRKNQKILVGYDLSSRDRCVIHHTPIPRNSSRLNKSVAKIFSDLSGQPRNALLETLKKGSFINESITEGFNP